MTFRIDHIRRLRAGHDILGLYISHLSQSACIRGYCLFYNRHVHAKNPVDIDGPRDLCPFSYLYYPLRPSIQLLHATDLASSLGVTRQWSSMLKVVNHADRNGICGRLFRTTLPACLRYLAYLATDGDAVTVPLWRMTNEQSSGGALMKKQLHISHRRIRVGWFRSLSILPLS